MGRKIATPKEIQELARSYGPEAIETLVDFMRNGNGEHAIAASKELINRGYGKAPVIIKDERTQDIADAILEKLTGEDMLVLARTAQKLRAANTTIEMVPVADSAK